MEYRKQTVTFATYLTAMREASRQSGVPVRVLMADGTALGAARARWIGWGLLRDRGYSEASIARVSGFDRTTVHYAVRKLKGITAPSKRPSFVTELRTGLDGIPRTVSLPLVQEARP